MSKPKKIFGGINPKEIWEARNKLGLTDFQLEYLGYIIMGGTRPGAHTPKGNLEWQTEKRILNKYYKWRAENVGADTGAATGNPVKSAES